MSILDSIRNIRHKAEKKIATTDRTVAEILGDKRESALFGDMLQKSDSEDDTELARNISARNLTPENLKRLDERRREFVEKMTQAKKLAETLSPDFLESVAKYIGDGNELSAVLLGNGGKDATAKLFSDQAYDLAINHPEQFARITEALEAQRQHHKNVDIRVKENTKKYGFSDDRYANIMALKDPNARYEGFREEIKKSFGLLRSILEKATFGLYSVHRADSFDRREEKAMNEAYLTDNVTRKVIGTVLTGLVTENDEMRKVFSHALLNETKHMRRGFSFTGLKDISEESLRKGWRNPNPRSPRTAAERDKHVDMWYQSVKKWLDEEGGVWATIGTEKLDDLIGRFDKNKLAL